MQQKTKLNPDQYTTTPPEGCNLKPGDQVIFTNDYGVKFQMVVYGFTLPGQDVHGRTVLTEGGAYWFPKHVHQFQKIS